jgi:probable H4MPT-linked C1 transfer pathway protein
MVTLGLDIGGAHLKAALGAREFRTRPFALWKEPGRLPAELAELVAGWAWDRVAVTMTGELCDCYDSRAAGVRAIVAAVDDTFGPPARYWTTDARFVDSAEAHGRPAVVASANWLALGEYAARIVPDAALVDVGSTTTDILRLKGGHAAPIGRTDAERLVTGELVYTGATRTPVCAVLGWGGMAEFFATTLDVNLVLGNVPENRDDLVTADGRPADRPHALARLARMIGHDRDDVDEEALTGLAERVFRDQVERIARAVEVIAGDARRAVVCGSGAFYAHRALDGFDVTDLADRLGPGGSVAAAATAVAELLGCG